MNCLKCNSVIDESKEKLIRCDGCNRPIHVHCSELTAVEIKCYELRSARKRMKYIGIFCEQGVHQIPQLISMITDLKEEVRRLRENGPGLTPSPVAVTEEIISEMLERNRRSSNIIIYGSVEQGSSKQEQVSQDTTFIKDLLIQLEIPQTDIKPQRLGGYLHGEDENPSDESNEVLNCKI
ncbi:hypothetical protein QE152_g39284 [Popillia japonica]|uniref:Phorbol-ester/DAG-type domain-containing protein n=1 Tax=Popillia japonica TaxID=7064 RepID=A0AAW1HU68_POPJA